MTLAAIYTQRTFYFFTQPIVELKMVQFVKAEGQLFIRGALGHLQASIGMSCQVSAHRQQPCF